MISGIARDLKEFCQDTSIATEVRWRVFCQDPVGAKHHEQRSIHPEEDVSFWNSEYFSWYDDFYVHRYETITAERVIKSMEEYTDEQILEVKEWFLQKFIWSFTNDW